METIPLGAFIEKNSDSKKIQKRIARAVKTYRHASRDLAHATADIAHAKEDCLHAMQMFDTALEDCQQVFTNWPNEEEEIVLELEHTDLHTEAEEAEEAEEAGEDDEVSADDDFEEFEEDEEDFEEEYDEHPATEAGRHLDHAAKDFTHAVEDAECVVEELCKVENLLFEIIEIASEDGYQIDLAEAKAHIVALAAKDASEGDKAA